MKYKFKALVDASGAPVSLWHGDRVGQEPGVCAAYMRATAYLLDRGMGMAPFNLVTNNHSVIWAEDENGKVMGGVIYEYHSHNKQGYIVLIFVEEEFKGRRIYSLLQQGLEDEVVRLGATSIASMAHVANEARLKAGEREGMFPQYIRLYKDLGPTLEDIKARLEIERGKPWKELLTERYSLATSYGGRPQD
jgi:GNAT superfamily N-acetyltransferase